MLEGTNQLVSIITFNKEHRLEAITLHSAHGVYTSVVTAHVRLLIAFA